MALSTRELKSLEEEVTDKVDEVLIMSVNPGFSGQTFITDVVDKVDELMAFRKSSKHSFVISMDGGINENNIKMLFDKGVDRVAVASGIFHSDNPVDAINNLRKLLK